jgi:hypothetical protein
LAQTIIQLADYFSEMLQDLPESGDGGPANDSVHWMAMEMYFYNHNGIIPGAYYMDTPYLQLQQLFRAHRIARGEDPNFLNRSDALLTRWMSDAAKEQRLKNAG